MTQNMPLNLLLPVSLAYEFISYNQAKAIASEAILGTAACFSGMEFESKIIEALYRHSRSIERLS